MRRNKLLVAMLAGMLSLGAVACSSDDDTETDTGAELDGGGDLGGEAEGDLGGEAEGDLGGEAGADAGTDAGATDLEAEG